MIPQYLTDLSNKFAPALGNHIWQSTLFAGAIALLTLAFRNNRARVRYWLWLAASLKFLVPFSLLMAVGTHLAVPRPSGAPRLDLYAAMQQASEPFAQAEIARTIPSSAAASPLHLSSILLAAWLCGVLVVFTIWYLRWRKVHVSVREAAPLSHGREWETLRRLERAEKRSRPIDIFVSHTSLEPGIFGIARPVLLWPKGISERLADAHLHAVLAHELWHVRRRDSLAAALHMFVEALFWFNPVVWWMGMRLLNERERACDEAVLESGGDRQVYAESILKICEFCVGFPLPCVSGVTSADLKQRITRIMSDHLTRKLDLGRKLLLAAAAVLAVTAPIAAGMLHLTPRSTFSPSTEFPVRSSKSIVVEYSSVSIAPSKSTGGNGVLMFGPNEFVSKDAPLQQVIRAAYGVEDDRIIGAPAWLATEKYDLDAKGGDLGGLSRRTGRIEALEPRVAEQNFMLQAMLTDRLKLAVHRATRELTVFALTLASSGPKLREAGDDAGSRPGIHLDHQAFFGHGVPVDALLWHLSRQLHRTVINETGLSAMYDFTLTLPRGVAPGINQPPPSESDERAIIAAVQQQLGLKLEPRKTSMEVIVIDYVERPVETHAQSPTAAPAIPVFQLISVKANKSGDEFSEMNVSLLPDDASAPTGRLVSGTNVPLFSYIDFAYKLTGNQLQLLLPNLPNWLLSDRFDLEAKAAGNNLSSDQLRLVMQAVLADRFHLEAHYETRQLPVYALVLAKPGTTGSQLNLHADNPPCPSAPLTNEGRSPYLETTAAGLPVNCGRIEPLRSSRLRVGARNIPIGLLASTLPQLGNLDRPVLDHTGLGGSYDFTFEVSTQHVDRANPRGVKPSPDFVRDLNDQLGLQLEPQTGSTEVFVIDRVEKPADL
jgi:bla regulator protein blaR1